MKTLWDLLEEGLPKVLPTDPDKAINGTELLKKIKNFEEFQDSNDNTLRLYFSLMAADLTSVLAKRPDKHGYYRRPEEIDDSAESSKKKNFEDGKFAARDEQREEKFRAIFMRFNEYNNYSAMKIEHTKGIKRDKGINKWKYPDVILLKWEASDVKEDDEFTLSAPLLEIRKSLGEQAFKLFSNELKVELKSSNLRESFFQCVSNSKWAHSAQFIIASEITDSPVVSELVRLSRSYDVTIISYQLKLEILDSLPCASEILEWDQGLFDEKIGSKITLNTISVGKERDSLDWDHLRDMMKQSIEFKSLINWISKCLTEEKPYKYNDYKKIAEIYDNY